jgi:chromosome segregation ATPase
VEEKIEHVVCAAHYREQMLVGDIAALVDRCSACADAMLVLDAEYTELVESHQSLQHCCLLLDAQKECLEADVGQLEAAGTDLRDECHREEEEHLECLARLKAEHDALEASHAAALEELSILRADVSRTLEETRLEVAGIQKEVASVQQVHDAAAASVNGSIADAEVDIAARKAAYRALKQDLEAAQAALLSRSREFERESGKCGAAMDAVMELSREMSYDCQQYESNIVEADNKRQRGEKEAEAAGRRAKEAEETSVEVEKEKAVSRDAFVTQIEDVRAAGEQLRVANEALCGGNEQLRSDEEVLAEAIERMEKKHEDRERPLLFRLRRAKDELEVFSLKDAEVVCRLDAKIAELEDVNARLMGQKAEYTRSLEDVHSSMEHVVKMRQEAEDAMFAAEGQAQALEQVIVGAKCGTMSTVAFSSWSRSGSRPAALSLGLGSGDGLESSSMMFDASFEEGDGGEIVASTTGQAVGDVRCGHGLRIAA